MTDSAPLRCPQCGAPLPTTAGGLDLLCPWCRSTVRLGAPAAQRELLLVDRGDRAEAALLLAQHLAARHGHDATVRGGGESRLLPFWSVLTRDGDLLTGPATAEEPQLLARLTLPSLPARPVAAAELAGVEQAPADVTLAAFLAAPRDAREPAAAVAPEQVERAWLIWVPVRCWQVRVGGRAVRALTVADSSVPVLAPLPAPARPPVRWRQLLELGAWCGCLVLAGRLLPLALHVPVAAALVVAGLWAWRRPIGRGAGQALGAPGTGGRG